MTWLTTLALLGVLVIAGLAFYLGKLLFMVKAQRQKREAAIAERNEKLLSSIHIIARAMLEEQCDFSEGAIRIRNLLDHLHPYKAYGERFPALFDLYKRVKDLPTHEARKELDKKELRRQDREREGWERELSDAIKAEAELLKDLSH
ncbi:DUF2489 domain-containing protein [Gallaecimonas kandeliae]|uniref:DUF2489 domain-containing protein n=1 Tax=Gallaecimonas kandeliae TaxID=3029055 RepID=UPI002647101E|nr:DUF2489 domain-containing protein [Gallaecimonas kandeliae]WKE65453.1 DUF2489 domain-containing protein [Gallaecimonas kandeliae]